MSPALNEDDGLSARFLKRTGIIRRHVAPVKQPYPLLKCLFVLSKPTKEFCHLCTYKRTLVKLEKITRGGRSWRYERHTTHSLQVCVYTCMSAHLIAILTALTFQFEEEFFRGAPFFFFLFI